MTSGGSMAIGAGAFALLLGLAGCVASDPFPRFADEASSDDRLPAVFDEVELDEFDLDTVRYSGSDGDVDYFLVKRADGTPCLAIAPPADPVIGCGGPSGWVTTSSPGATAQLVPAPAEDRDGWKRVSDNVLVPIDR